MKKTVQPIFSNATEMMRFESANCENCVKGSFPVGDGWRYTNADKNNMPKCSIQRDYMLQYMGREQVNERSFNICQDYILRGVKCPFLMGHYPKKSKKIIKQQLKIAL